MRKFREQGNINDKDYMIHVLNNCPEEYDLIFDSLENNLMTGGADTVIIGMICKKLNHQSKMENKKVEKRQKRH